MTLSAVDFDPAKARAFLDEVAQSSGQNLSAGCPVADRTRFFTPDRLVRTVILGDSETALSSPLTWYCVSCYTCGTRCPNGIQTGKITEALKKLSRKRRVHPYSPRIASFHDAFVAACRRRGRVNETEFMGAYEMRNMGRMLLELNFPAVFAESSSQAKLGLSMLKQKRLHFGITRVKALKEVRGLFSPKRY
jgi:heterodisulfide reductase subunit C